MPPRKAGGRASPYDHSQVDESDLASALESAQKMVEGEPADALTPIRVVAISALVKLGVPLPTAATSLRCGRVVGRWAKKGRDDAERDIPPGFGPGESPHRYFIDEMAAAQAQAEASLVTAIAMAAPNDWKAAAYLLERRYTKRWNLTSKLEIQAGAGKQLEISSFSTDKLLQIAKGLLPEDSIKVTKALPADTEDAELVEHE